MSRYNQANCETGVADLFQFLESTIFPLFTQAWLTEVDAMINWSATDQEILPVWWDIESYFSETLWCVSFSWIEYSLHNTLCLITDIVNASRVILYSQHIHMFCLQYDIVTAICQIHFPDTEIKIYTLSSESPFPSR